MVTRIPVTGLAVFLALIASPAWALEECNVTPQGMQDISKALQCLDRNIKSLSQQPVGGSSGPAASVPLSGKYVAGTYTSPDGKLKFQLSGPTKMGDREKWQLSSDDGTIQVTWITGIPQGHPMLLGTKLIEELSSAYDYGRMGKQSYIDASYWMQGRLIGVTPTNDGLTVSRFHKSGGNVDDAIESASFSVRLPKGSR